MLRWFQSDWDRQGFGFLQLNVFLQSLLSFVSFEVLLAGRRYISPSLFLASRESSELVHTRSSVSASLRARHHCSFVHCFFCSFLRLHYESESKDSLERTVRSQEQDQSCPMLLGLETMVLVQHTWAYLYAMPVI